MSNIKNNIPLILSFIIYFIAALIASNMMYTTSDSFLMMLIIELAMLFVGILIHLIVHEAGHMVFGLLTHYRFSSFRIGSWMLQKNASGFHLKRFSIPGTAGQCLMVPPQDQKNFPYVLSNLGGGLANLIVSGLSLVAYFYTTNELLSNLEACLFAYGIALALTNLIPMKIGLVANDGMNIILLKKDANARLAFHQQLTVSSLLSEGYRYKEMDVSLFINDGDPSNSLISTIYLFEIVRLFDEHDFNQAQMKIAALEEYDLLGLHEILLELYRCYLSLIHGDEPSDLSPSAVKLVRTMTVDPIVLATRYGLNLHDENDQDQKKLEKILKNFKRTYPNQGEVTLAFELIALLDETHQKTDA